MHVWTEAYAPSPSTSPVSLYNSAHRRKDNWEQQLMKLLNRQRTISFSLFLCLALTLEARWLHRRAGPFLPASLALHLLLVAVEVGLALRIGHPHLVWLIARYLLAAVPGYLGGVSRIYNYKRKQIWKTGMLRWEIDAAQRSTAQHIPFHAEMLAFARAAYLRVLGSKCSFQLCLLILYL